MADPTSVMYRCLALTGSFETSCAAPECFGGVAGDFDGQGLSFGALQWNVGQNTLQPMLREMDLAHNAVMRDVFAEQYAAVASMLEQPVAAQLSWARSIQEGRHAVSEPWNQIFRRLGTTDEFQAIQLKSAGEYFQTALQLMEQYTLHSERGAALMFDIAVQNGSISQAARANILSDFAALPAEASEVARMVIIA